MAERSPSGPAAWRGVVQTAALRATLDEAGRRWENHNPPFNYRWEHVCAVVRLAVRLAPLTGADLEVVEAAAWLHDICKKGRDDDHGCEGAQVARNILSRTDFPSDKVERVADAISKHVGLSSDPELEPLEAAVLWDADKLAKLGATAVVHFLGYRMMDGPTTAAQLLDQLQSQPWQQSAVESLHTAPARSMGRARLEVYRSFWEQARLELDGDDLP